MNQAAVAETGNAAMQTARSARRIRSRPVDSCKARAAQMATATPAAAPVGLITAASARSSPAGSARQGEGPVSAT